MKIPYEDLRLEFLEKERKIILSLPWAMVEADLLDIESFDEIKKVIAEFPQNITSSEFQKFLNFFEGLSFYYDAPRDMGGLEKKPDLRARVPRASTLKCGTSYESDIFKNICERKFMNQKGDIDPLSAFGGLKERALKGEYEHDLKFPIYEKLNILRKEDEDVFFKKLGVILNQTYYITKNFCSAVQPCVDTPSSIVPMLEKLYQEEVGHYKLVKSTMDRLDISVDENTVFQCTKDLLKIIAFAKKNSPLSLALCIDMLEGDYYPESDPLCDIIERSTKPEASVGLKKHFSINQKHDHKDFGKGLVKELPFLTKEEFENAARIASWGFGASTEITENIDILINIKTC